MGPCNGGALLEFALVFPFLFVLLFGAIELGRNVLIAERVEKAGYVLSDLASQYPSATGEHAAGEINAAEILNTVFPQMKTIMGDYYAPEKQKVILTAVRKEAGVLRIKWQIGGGGRLEQDVASIVNGASPNGSNPSARDGLAHFNDDPQARTMLADMAPGETLIVGEMFYRYEPILTTLLQGVTQAFGEQKTFYLSPRTMAKRMYFQPRNDTKEMTCLPDDFLYDECQVAPSQHSVSCTCVYSGSQRLSNCGTRSATANDYYRCSDGTTRLQTAMTGFNAAGCGGNGFGTYIENYSNAALTGSCVNQ